MLIVTSTEGRIAVEYLDMQPEIQMKKYSFKWHRTENEIYAVNWIAFHPSYGTFASGGSDKFVYMWDPVSKKRLWKSKEFTTNISSLSFSHDGSKLAIASSYLYENGYA